MNIRLTLAEGCTLRKAQRLRNIARDESRDALRRCIVGKDHIDAVRTVIDILAEGAELVWRQDDDGTPVQRLEDLDKDRIASLDKAAQLSLRLLNKVLPDITQKELTALEGDALFGKESKEEIEAELRRLGVDPEALELTAALG